MKDIQEMIQRMKGPMAVEPLELPVVKSEHNTEPKLMTHLKTQLETQIKQGEKRKGYPDDLKVKFSDENEESFRLQLIETTPGLQLKM